jgi:hypothetical protein
MPTCPVDTPAALAISARVLWAGLSLLSFGDRSVFPGAVLPCACFSVPLAFKSSLRVLWAGSGVLSFCDRTPSCRDRPARKRGDPESRKSRIPLYLMGQVPRSREKGAVGRRCLKLQTPGRSNHPSMTPRSCGKSAGCAGRSGPWRSVVRRVPRLGFIGVPAFLSCD